MPEKRVFEKVPATDVGNFDQAADSFYYAESLKAPLNTLRQRLHKPPQIAVPIG